MAGGAGGKGQMPGVPDYMGAANAMGNYSAQATAYQTYANRPNMYTPYGNVTWTPPENQTAAATGTSAGLPGNPDAAPPDVQTGSGSAPGNYHPGEPEEKWRSFRRLLPNGGSGGGGPSTGTGSNPMLTPGQWTMNMELNPAQQAALEAQQRLGAARSGLGETLFGRAQSELGAAPDWASLPGAPNAQTARQQAIDAVYVQASSRLDPQWNQRGEGLRTQLLNEGLRPGMAGYDQRMQEFERARTDAYNTAMNSAIMGGEQAAAGEFGRGLQGRQQGIAELLQRRGSTLNEINALLGGQQVGMPQMPGFSPAGMPPTPNYLGAMGQQYDAQLNKYNAGQAQMQSLMGGGASMLPYLMML